jgi:HlyD family secretion protein
MIRFAYLSKLRWTHAAAVIAGASAAYLGMNWWLGPQVAVESVVKRDFVQTVVASGRVESPHRVGIGAQITATVTKIPVSEGDNVKAQDVLIELAATELLATGRQADIAITQAQARIRQLEELQAPIAEQALRQARTHLQNTHSVLKRNQALFNQGFVGEAALDESRKAVELADSQVSAAQKQLETTRATGSDYAMAETAIREARAASDAAHARAKYAVIRAPLEGILIGRNVEVGEVVQPGKVLMTLSPKGKTQLVLAIDEKNLRLIAWGQKAIVSAEAYPQQKFDASVVYINPGVNAQTGAVEVKLDVGNPPAYLRQDMTVSVDIEVARRTQTLLLSAASVHDVDGPSPWVLRVDSGRAVKAPVKVGLRSGGVVEVLQGLGAGDTVVSGATLILAGARVRTKASPP